MSLLELLGAAGTAAVLITAITGAVVLVRGQNTRTTLELLQVQNTTLTNDRDQLQRQVDRLEGQVRSLSGTFARDLARAFSDEVRNMLTELRSEGP